MGRLHDQMKRNLESRNDSLRTRSVYLACLKDGYIPVVAWIYVGASESSIPTGFHRLFLTGYPLFLYSLPIPKQVFVTYHSTRLKDGIWFKLPQNPRRILLEFSDKNYHPVAGERSFSSSLGSETDYPGVFNLKAQGTRAPATILLLSKGQEPLTLK